MPSSLTQIRVLEVEPLPDPVLGLLCLLSEHRDFARGLAPAVEPTEQGAAVAEREEAQVEGEVVVAAVEEEEEEEVAAAEAAAALGTRLDGSFTSRKEQSSSTRREN